jgi:hypothetical protein
LWLCGWIDPSGFASRTPLSVIQCERYKWSVGRARAQAGGPGLVGGHVKRAPATCRGEKPPAGGSGPAGGLANTAPEVGGQRSDGIDELRGAHLVVERDCASGGRRGGIAERNDDGRQDGSHSPCDFDRTGLPGDDLPVALALSPALTRADSEVMDRSRNEKGFAPVTLGRIG